MGYKVYAGGLTANVNGVLSWVDPQLIYAPEGDSGVESLRTDTTPLLDAVVRLSKNAVSTFEFTVPYAVQTTRSSKPLKNRYYDKFKLEQTFVSVVEDDSEELFFGYVSEMEDGIDRSRKITCQSIEGLMKHDDARILSQSNVYLSWKKGGDDFANPSIAGTCIREQYFRDAEEASGFGTLTIHYGEDGTYLQDQTIDTTDQGETLGSKWDLLNNYLLDEYDGYFHIYRKLQTEKNWTGPFELYAWYRGDVPDKTNQAITYGENLLDLTVTRSLPSDFANIVNCYSKVTKTKGWWIFKTSSTQLYQGVAKNEASIKKYGPVRRIVAVDNVSSEDELDKLAQKQLKEYDTEADEELTVEALDLHDSGISVDHLGFLKKTRIVSPEHGIDGWYVCTEATISLEDATAKKFKFGSPSKKLTRQQGLGKALLSNTIKQIKGVIGHLNS